MTAAAKQAIESCTTAAQVRKTLNAHGLKVIRDTTAETGTFSVWIDSTTRIYQPHKRRNMVVQTWQRVTMKYSGTPTYFR